MWPVQKKLELLYRSYTTPGVIISRSGRKVRSTQVSVSQMPAPFGPLVYNDEEWEIKYPIKPQNTYQFLIGNTEIIIENRYGKYEYIITDVDEKYVTFNRVLKKSWLPNCDVYHLKDPFRVLVFTLFSKGLGISDTEKGDIDKRNLEFIQGVLNNNKFIPVKRLSKGRDIHVIKVMEHPPVKLKTKGKNVKDAIESVSIQEITNILEGMEVG